MKKSLLAAGIVALAACSDATSPTRISTDGLKPAATLLPGNNTVVVQEADVVRQVENSMPTGDWVLFTRVSADVESGEFTAGPGAPPLGTGAFTTETVGAGSKVYLFNYDHIGTALANIDAISYSTYKTLGATSPAFPGLNIQIDINGGAFNAGEFRTLVFEPYLQPGFVNAVGVWESREAFNGGAALWWSTGVSSCPQSAPCAWSALIGQFPGATIVGGFGINQGSGNAGITGATDALSIAYGGDKVTYDFEGALGACSVSVSGTTLTLLSDCVTDRTVAIPDGFTLDGDGFSITAVDPAVGGFLGAVVRNGGATASVTNVTVTVSGLADICHAGDNRLRGIMLDGAAGSITNNTVTGINQGASGCQEGNAIEVRNSPFNTTGPDLAVTISGNIVSNYQKTGIIANGSVKATITGNTVTGIGPINYIAQNGIQVGFGATAVVQNNSASGNDYTGFDVACGLLLFEADGVKTSKNTLFSNERDICNFGKGGGNVKPVN